ncbi:Potassium voltage-gated channel sub H member 7 [Chytriomyces hyalinus]|nr:Potassium voltage-gated channel sub H member 7 [Chytriomyces hyalinus]
MEMSNLSRAIRDLKALRAEVMARSEEILSLLEREMLWNGVDPAHDKRPQAYQLANVFDNAESERRDSVTMGVRLTGDDYFNVVAGSSDSIFSDSSKRTSVAGRPAPRPSVLSFQLTRNGSNSFPRRGPRNGAVKKDGQQNDRKLSGKPKSEGGGFVRTTSLNQQKSGTGSSKSELQNEISLEGSVEELATSPRMSVKPLPIITELPSRSTSFADVVAIPQIPLENLSKQVFERNMATKDSYQKSVMIDIDKFRSPSITSSLVVGTSDISLEAEDIPSGKDATPPTIEMEAGQVKSKIASSHASTMKRKKSHSSTIKPSASTVPTVARVVTRSGLRVPPAPTKFQFYFLLPAFDHRGRIITPEVLAEFGEISATFRLNGIHPRSRFMNVWDITATSEKYPASSPYVVAFAKYLNKLARTVIYMLFLWIIPFLVAFHETFKVVDPWLVSAICSTFYLIDSIFSLLTPQVVASDFAYNLAEYEKARPPLRDWMVHWCKTRLLIEVLTLLPFANIFVIPHAEILQLIQLFRIYRLWESLSRCPSLKSVEILLDEVTGASTSKAAPIVFLLFFFIHFNACTIFYMGHMTGFVGWRTLWPLFDDAGLFEMYTWTFFKAVGNMFPSSFNPWRAEEQIASLIYSILAAIIYAVFLGAISSATMSVNPAGRLFDQKIGELRDYIRWKDLSEDTEDKLISYYESRYRGKFFEEDVLLADFNDSLKAEILLHNTRKLIEGVPFLKRTQGDGRDELFIGRIATALHSLNFIPGDFVTKQGDTGSDMFFILNGKVEVYVNGKYAITLCNGAYFGEVGLITKTLRTATVLARLPSILYRLTYADFHLILDDFLDMKQRIDLLAQERESVIRQAELRKYALKT